MSIIGKSPVNQPKGVGVENLCPFSRDGQMRFLDNNQGGGPHYYPNNQGVYDSQPEFKTIIPVDGDGYEYNSVKMMIITSNNLVVIQTTIR